MDKPRCQSCGMPLGAEGYYGTEADGSENRDYCMYCYRDGAFTKPNMTVDQMIDSSVQFITKNLKFTEKTAREMSDSVIRGLNRWKK